VMGNRDNAKKWMKAANNKIQSLQKNGTWKKCRSPKTRLEFYRVPGFFDVNVLPMAPSASTKHGNVYGEILKKLSRKLLPQSWLGVLYSCSLYCCSHHLGKLASSTSAASLSKLRLWIQLGSTCLADSTLGKVKAPASSY
jgi:hypothetical protein